MAERQFVDGVIVALPPEQFVHILQTLQRMSPEEAGGVASATLAEVERVGKKRDLSKNRVLITDAPLNIDNGTLISWCKKVQAQHKAAVKQLVCIDATAAVRSGVTPTPAPKVEKK